MAARIKAGLTFALQALLEDENAAQIEAVEFMFKQEEDSTAPVLKTAYWSRDGASRDCELAEETETELTIHVHFSRADTYLFEQGEPFFMDTRVHYEGVGGNPYTPIVRLRMGNSLFGSGEEATADG